jgi:acetyl esterase/lipase
MILSLALAGPAGADALPSHADIRYGPRERNVMDIYLPAQSGTAPPVVLFIHGGRWFRNDKTQIHVHARAARLTASGIAVASMNHTYSSEAVWPAQREDVVSALRFLQAEGVTYGVDGTRMAVWGQSSGAHLALWAGLISVEDPGLSLAAIVSWYAPSDLFALRADRIADAVPGANERFAEPSPESRLLGVSVPDNRRVADAASPALRVGQTAAHVRWPDTFLAHGTADFVVSPLQTDRLAEILRDRFPEADVDLVRVAGAGHGGDEFGPVADDVIEFLGPRLGLH